MLSLFVDTTEVLDLMGFYREFRRSILEEIDYSAEAATPPASGSSLRTGRRSSSPACIEGYTPRRVLVLEWVEGIKINDYARSKPAGVDPREVARRTVEAYFYQFFEAGFFHADPHPGNIFVQAGTPATAPAVAFVDFGMVGTLTPR